MTLKNNPTGSYREIFHKASDVISEKKLHRYSADEIIRLNRQEADDYTRECSVCKRIGRVGEDGVCEICRGIVKLSPKILYEDFFAVTENAADGLPLPGNRYLTAGDRNHILSLQKQEQILHVYAKNKRFTGKQIATKLWVGNYSTGDTFEELAKKSKGIDRIGILRADVDDLGMAFVMGFDNPSNDNRYVTLSRTAVLSRQLSLFFKYFINGILKEAEYRIEDEGEKAERSATIVYSGGDDVFIVGAWDDVLEIGVDLRRKLLKFTDGTLTMSAGFGIYPAGYPIHMMAEEVGRMESMAKHHPGKNAITLFDGKVYSWQELEDEVIEDKYKKIARFFTRSPERGKSFLYRLLDLTRKQDDRIHFARFVYLLTRMEPAEDASEEYKEEYHVFSKNMMKWIASKKDRLQLESAMTIYAYRIRETED